jgi:hypothetical protein
MRLEGIAESGADLWNASSAESWRERRRGNIVP